MTKSSVDLNHTNVGDIIVLEFDSHALLGEGLASNSLFGVTQVSCDMQSRAWNHSPTGFFFNPVWGEKAVRLIPLHLPLDLK